MLGVWPNPSPRDARVHLSLPQPGTVTLSLFDVRGRRVARQEWRSLDPGPHALKVPGNGTLAPGLYFVEARYDDVRAMRRLVVVR